MKTFFTADLHFDGPKFYGNPRCTRPFTGEKWNALMIDTINRLVDYEDRLVILGDFASYRPGYWRLQIRCKNVILILGNHDNEVKCRNVFGGNLRVTCNMKILGHVHVFLSHYPHAFWNGSHKGWLHLYGHCHNQREAVLDALWPERRAMDVSPDTAYAKFGEWRPFSDTEVFELIGKRAGHDLVEF